MAYSEKLSDLMVLEKCEVYSTKSQYSFSISLNLSRNRAITHQKCDNADDDAADGDMLPMCRPCFAGDTKIILFPRDLHTRRVGSPVIMWIHTLEQGGPGHAPLENFD